MPVIDISLMSPRQHSMQVCTGLLMLAEQGYGGGLEVMFHDRLAEYASCDEGRVPILVAEYEGMCIVYDLEDQTWTKANMRTWLDACDLYFERSYAPQVNEAHFTAAQRDKMHPLGLNYFVDYPGNPYSWESAPAARLSVRSLAYKVRKMLDGRMVPARFEHLPDTSYEQPRVVFSARLWDPSESSAYDREDRRAINEMRIGLVRALRAHMGAAYVGGITDTPYAREVCPDLVLSHSVTRRSRYLRDMQQAQICVASTGLHGSTGGRLGEYVAASRAIVTEPLCAIVPGAFAEGTNYRVFRSPEECVAQIDELMGDREAVLAMQRANRSYYERYLRPDVLVARTLKMATEMRG